jgi:hypothetical protein
MGSFFLYRIPFSYAAHTKKTKVLFLPSKGWVTTGYQISILWQLSS